MRSIIYVATGNKSKLNHFIEYFNWIDPELSVKLVPDFVRVFESGNSLDENSKLKLLPYIGKYNYPVISNDSGLFFDKEIKEIEDPIKIKRNVLNGKSEDDLTQEEISNLIFNFYKGIAKKYGGKLDCEMRDVFSILLPNKKIHQIETSRYYTLVDRDTSKCDLYSPLNSLRISKLVGKYMNEFTKEDEKIDKKVIIDAMKSLLHILSK